MKAFRRIQIRECILSHIEKEKHLFNQGIKVLSLFFIDSVAKYRTYNELGEQQLGEYAQIFEEEYAKIRDDERDLTLQEYDQYLMRDNPNQIHNGYFSIDKNSSGLAN